MGSMKLNPLLDKRLAAIRLSTTAAKRPKARGTPALTGFFKFAAADKGGNAGSCQAYRHRYQESGMHPVNEGSHRRCPQVNDGADKQLQHQISGDGVGGYRQGKGEARDHSSVAQGGEGGCHRSRWA